MKKLTLGSDFSIPLDAVTQTFGVLAVRRAGKSNAAAVLAEEFFAAKQPFVVVDPKGDWWGLRSSSDGLGPGLPIPVFGGDHADVPLERAGGAMLAELIVEHRLSCVVDTSDFSEGDKLRFLIDFAERLYRRNRDPLHVFLEEADDYIPQKPFREEARCVGAFNRLVRRGGFKGMGVTLISQRSAVVNKDVLTQVETLIVLRTTSPQDRKAIAGWLEHQGQSREILASLAQLEDGEAWILSPHFLKLEGPRRIRFRRRATFDSGATPKASQKRREPSTLADVDLAAVRERMAATIERAKAEDPRELRRRIAELESKLTERPAAPAKVELREIQVLDEKLVGRVENAILAHAREWLKALDKSDQVQAAVKELQKTIAAAKNGHRAPAATRISDRAGVSPPPVGPTGSSSDIGKSGLRRMLIALAQRNGLSASQLGVRARLSSKSGTFDTYLSRARSNGWIVGTAGRLEITNEGRASLGEWEPLPTGAGLLDYWLEMFGSSGAARMLKSLAEAYPRALSKEELGEASNLSAASGTFDTYLSRLRTLELVQGRGELRASAELFE